MTIKPNDETLIESGLTYLAGSIGIAASPDTINNGKYLKISAYYIVIINKNYCQTITLYQRHWVQIVHQNPETQRCLRTGHGWSLHS